MRVGAFGEVSAVLMAGPTASGKSALALKLARAANGVIINADSMQVYADLRVLSARPSDAEMADAPHRLYGHVDGAEEYTVARWLADVAPVLAEIRAAGQLPIFVGGTGLYFKALTQGLVELPPIPPEVSALWRERADDPAFDLHQALTALDPEGAVRLNPADRARLARALEVIEGTGQTMRHWQQAQNGTALVDPAASARLFLSPEREALRARIDARFLAMMEEGALEEVRALLGRGLAANRGVMKAHGVPHLIAHLRGELSLEAAITRGQADTRAYAKRQHTWFRHQLPDWHWVDPAAASVKLLGESA